MKKDNLATLRYYNNNQLLSNLQRVISIVLNIQTIWSFFTKICKQIVNIKKTS